MAMDDTLVGDIYINMTREAQLFVAVYVTTLGTVATIGNISTLIILLRFSTFRKKSINFILINMAVSDLGVSISGYPMTSSSAFAGHWLFGDSGCRYIALCVYTFSCSSIGSHVALAVYRYIYVCKPSLIRGEGLHHDFLWPSVFSPTIMSLTEHKLTPKVTFKVMGIIWAYVFFWTLTPFLGWSSYTYEPFGLSCSLDWTGRSVSHLSYNTACVLGVFFAPLIIILYCYFRVAKRSNQVDPTRMEEKDLGVVMFLQMHRKDVKVDFHVTKMCIMMTASFVIAWTPYAVVCIWVVFSRLELNTATALAPTLFAKSSCMMNPLIYFIASSRYRRDFLRMFRASQSGAPALQGSGGGAGLPLADVSRSQKAGPSTASDNTRGALYLRRTTSPSGDVSASMYFNKERIYIGDIKPSGIDREAKLIHKDPDVLSMSSSNTSEYQVVVKETKKAEEPTIELEIKGE
ncbi:visual pigment-like receptor peropsin [Acanthaster planci]|uniref:Visual pigment-like receptor peropsin n=1 Tax=Acanthaster planci TaxID=133434 RepID=A0A8B7ZHJ7_ACAPL|nr:visual pigment-like receptor peropsin [Acanthaster planci]